MSPEIPEKISQIHSIFQAQKFTLSLAESCTGGLLSFWLTQLPGASAFFLGSVVSYSHHVKTQQLQIPKELLMKKGAVNSAVCQMMAQNLRTLWGSDWALSVTGVAGPDRGIKDPPVGTVFIGIAGPDSLYVEKKLMLKETTRYHIQHASAIQAVDKLYSSIKLCKNVT